MLKQTKRYWKMQKGNTNSLSKRVWTYSKAGYGMSERETSSKTPNLINAKTDLARE